MTFHPHTAGVVQTVGVDEGKYYLRTLDLWSDISPPRDHVTLVSVPFLDLYRSGSDRLELREGREPWSPRLFTAFRSQAPPAAVYRSRSLHVHFVSSRYAERSRGFRLLFTYHRVRVTVTVLFTYHRVRVTVTVLFTYHRVRVTVTALFT